jgi:hypothetical protein
MTMGRAIGREMVKELGRREFGLCFGHHDFYRRRLVTVRRLLGRRVRQSHPNSGYFKDRYVRDIRQCSYCLQDHQVFISKENFDRGEAELEFEDEAMGKFLDKIEDIHDREEPIFGSSSSSSNSESWAVEEIHDQSISPTHGVHEGSC